MSVADLKKAVSDLINGATDKANQEPRRTGRIPLAEALKTLLVEQLKNGILQAFAGAQARAVFHSCSLTGTPHGNRGYPLARTGNPCS